MTPPTGMKQMDPVMDYPARREPGPQTAVVLMVDDQVTAIETMRQALAGQAGIDFHSCTDPHDALNVATQTRPTVILQGLVLPGVDGLTLIRAYRANPATRDVPIVALAASEDATVKNAAFKAGASDYLAGQPGSVELLARLRYHSRAYLTMLQHDEARHALRLSQRQLLEANLELRRLTNADGLTGLANRRYFDEYLSAEWNRAMLERQEINLLMIDVDHFRRYNDTYGHMAGDEVLKKLAATISGCCSRAVDLAARFGGEEFAVVLPGAPAGGARLIAEKIRRSVEGLHIPHRDSTTADWLTVSVGLASCLPERLAPLTQLIDAADSSLHQAKQQGRNRVR